MQSAFAMHDPHRFKVFIYALSASDNSVYRQRIERQSGTFRDVTSWNTDRITEQIVKDGIHICELYMAIILNDVKFLISKQ